MNNKAFVEVYSDKVLITTYSNDTNSILGVYTKPFYDEDNNVSFSLEQFLTALMEYKKTHTEKEDFYLILSETFNADFCNVKYDSSEGTLEEVIRNELIIKIQNTSYENKEILFKAIQLNDKEVGSDYHVLFIKKEIVKVFVECFRKCNLDLKDVLFDNICLHHLFQKYHSNCIASDQENTFMLMLDIKESGAVFIGDYQNDFIIFPLKYGLNFYVSIGHLQFDTDILELFEIYLKAHTADFNFLKIILSGNGEKNSEIINYLNDTKFPVPVMIHPAFDFSKLFSLKENKGTHINVVLGAIQYLNSPLYTINFMDEFDDSLSSKIKKMFNKLFKKKEIKQ